MSGTNINPVSNTREPDIDGVQLNPGPSFRDHFSRIALALPFDKGAAHIAKAFAPDNINMRWQAFCIKHLIGDLLHDPFCIRSQFFRHLAVAPGAEGTKFVIQGLHQPRQHGDVVEHAEYREKIGDRVHRAEEVHQSCHYR